MGQMPDRGEQIRAERMIRTAARTDGGQHPGEGLGHDVIGHVGRDHGQREPTRVRCVLDVKVFVRPDLTGQHHTAACEGAGLDATISDGGLG